MSGRTDCCRGCGLRLVGPPHARAIRCSACGAVTALPPPPQDAALQFRDSLRRAKDWVKWWLQVPPNSSPAHSSGHRRNGPAAAYGGGGGGGGAVSTMWSPSYPTVRGSKRALLVGIMYKWKRYELKGSVNDVNCMRFLLTEKLGFPPDCILVLTEEERDPYRIPTRENMRAAMRWLVHGCQRGDSLVFHFSGHGSQQIDIHGDELDGRDETLCPLDYETNGMISDDEVNATIVRPLVAGATLHAVIDACHSGTALDLPYFCRMNRDGSWKWESHDRSPKHDRATCGGLAICFSGCDDNQTSSDTSAFAVDTVTGALTYCFIQAVESGPGMTYGAVLFAMRSAIRDVKTGLRISGPIASLLKKLFQTGLTQEPQLSSSQVFDIYTTPFNL